MTPQPTAVFTINTLANPNITAQPEVSQEICENGLVNALQVSANGSGNTYQWYSNTGNTNTGGVAINGQITTTYTPSSLNAGTLYYYVTVTNEGCSTTSNTAAVIVSPALEISSPASSSVCINEPATTLQVTVTNQDSAGSYQWYVNVNPTNTGGTVIGGATTASYLAPTDVVGTQYYYAVATFLGQVCPEISSSPATVTVIQTPVLSGGNETIYSGNSFSFQPGQDPNDILPAGTTYSWPTPTVSNTGIVGANAASGVSSISQTLVNNSD